MLALLCLWLGISTPLVFLGYYFGYRKYVSIVVKNYFTVVKSSHDVCGRHGGLVDWLVGFET